MKRFLAFLTALMLISACTVCLSLSAAAGEYAAGEVLYHQDFSVLSDLEKSGIVRGTSSSESAEFTCADDSLELNTFDNDRVYALLPAPEKTAEDSYTIEFGFSFSEIRSNNGYIGFILTCRGTEPTNVTALVIRADGTIDEFEEPDDALKKAIGGGKEILVKIPIEKNVLHKIEMTADGKTYTLERESVKVIDDGGKGFVVRNASVNVSEIYMVDGTGYTKKSGIFATESYASDDAVTTVETLMNPNTQNSPIHPADPAETVPVSPDTGENLVPYAAAFAAAAVGLFRRKKPRA